MFIEVCKDTPYQPNNQKCTVAEPSSAATERLALTSKFFRIRQIKSSTVRKKLSLLIKQFSCFVKYRTGSSRVFVPK